jgi:hypothetical protein
MTEFNIYCDESCHLENDGQGIMVLGAVTCPIEKTSEIASRVRELKKLHGLPPTFDIKWTKVSPAKRDFYLAVLDYFFDDDDLRFRALVVPDKAKLDHDGFQQTHDDFYFKMYFDLLKVLFDPASKYNIYLDIKDSRSAEKTRKLHEVLCNNAYDFRREIVNRIELVRSEHVQQVQLADLLIGAVSYANRGLRANSAKSALVQRMRERSRYVLTKSTLLQSRKVNLFVWQSREAASHG